MKRMKRVAIHTKRTLIRTKRTGQPMSDHVSAAEAAELLVCSESYIRKLIGLGDLSAKKVKGRWRVSRADIGAWHKAHGDSHEADKAHEVSREAHGDSHEADKAHGWRDDLLAQVARLEAREDALYEEASRREAASGEREERWKARIVDLERVATVRESRIADMETTHAAEVSELRGQVANLEAELRDSHSRAEANALGWAQRADELSHRIADLVDKHHQANARVYELEPVAEQVPMLQAAVEEKDASLSERERELGNMRQDLETIASRPVTGPVFRLLTKGKLRR
jgi:excisionase family DNA binding protein